MAKKFVRGITDIKNIEHQDFDTNNVNDLLSDGKHNYIHRKKSDGTEEYHNLTNNLKTLEAEDNGLLTVRNYNNSTNSAKLTVHHDSQKEQKLYSTDHTIEIVQGDNGTGEFTNIDVNPTKILEMVAPTFNEYASIEVNKSFMQTYTRPVNEDYEEFHLLVCLNKLEDAANFTLNAHDLQAVQYIFSHHGINNQININNGIFTVTENGIGYYNNSAGASYNNFVTSFSYIVPKNPTE